MWLLVSIFINCCYFEVDVVVYVIIVLIIGYEI